MPNPIRRWLILAFAFGPLAAQYVAQAMAPSPSRVSFGVIGDFGTGSPRQYDLARVMAAVHARSRFELVLTVGDNIYGGWSQRAIVERFETPYRPLLDAGVAFFASLGNHDAIQERVYPRFNMNGERYYTFTRSGVAFFEHKKLVAVDEPRRAAA